MKGTGDGWQRFKGMAENSVVEERVVMILVWAKMNNIIQGQFL